MRIDALTAITIFLMTWPIFFLGFFLISCCFCCCFIYFSGSYVQRAAKVTILHVFRVIFMEACAVYFVAYCTCCWIGGVKKINVDRVYYYFLNIYFSRWCACLKLGYKKYFGGSLIETCIWSCMFICWVYLSVFVLRLHKMDLFFSGAVPSRFRRA